MEDDLSNNTMTLTWWYNLFCLSKWQKILFWDKQIWSFLLVQMTLLGTSKFDSICLFLVQMIKSSLGHANLILFACPNNKILFGTSKFDPFCLYKWQNPPLRQANLTLFVCPSAKFYLVCLSKWQKFDPIQDFQNWLQNVPSSPKWKIPHIEWSAKATTSGKVQNIVQHLRNTLYLPLQN